MILFEWQSGKFDKLDKRDAFISYLARIWGNRPKLTEDEVTEEEKHERKINKQRFFDFTVDGNISARNYVGVVQYEDIRISIFPKIFKKTGELSKTEIQKFQINLLYWLSFNRKIQFPFSIASLTTMNFDDLLESMIYMYASYTAKILAEQPFQAYQTVEEETSYLKGSLLFDNYISKNLSNAKWQHFYCSYQPFVYDNLFNRIVKFVTKRLLNLSANPVNKELLSSILFILDDVSDVSCVEQDCDKVKLNPHYLELQQVLNLSRMFLSNLVIDSHSSDADNFCFLLPMEFIFEEFIYGFLSSQYKSLQIKSQSYDYLARTQGSDVFQIKNDIYIERILLIDTKYKIRSKDEGLKAGVSQTDMYQMISYSIRRECPSVLLLYPYSTDGNNQPSTFTVSNLNNEEIVINVRSIDISFDSITEICKSLIAQFKAIDRLFA